MSRLEIKSKETMQKKSATEVDLVEILEKESVVEADDVEMESKGISDTESVDETDIHSDIIQINYLQTWHLLCKQGNELFLGYISGVQEQEIEIDPKYLWIKTLLDKYLDVFLDELPDGLPPQRIIDHHIELIPGAEPTAKAPYRMSTNEL